MIATDRFVFLHLHKAGGSFVNQCLRRFVPGAREVGYHLPRLLIPERYQSLPVLGLVRNPWSYYVSWYAFQSRRPKPNALFHILSDGGRLPFAATVRNMLELGSGGALLEPLLAALPSGYGNRGLNLPGFALAPIRDSGAGFYSYLHDYLYGAAGPTHAGCAESLREDLLRMLAAVEQPVGAAMRLYILGEPARNVSEHGAYARYYDPELRDLVAEKDASLITRYSYRFEA
jgi:hypothetical protein